MLPPFDGGMPSVQRGIPRTFWLMTGPLEGSGDGAGLVSVLSGKPDPGFDCVSAAKHVSLLAQNAANNKVILLWKCISWLVLQNFRCALGSGEGLYPHAAVSVKVMRKVGAS